MNILWAIIVIILLIIINGIFSAGEFAIVSSRKSKIKEMIKEGGGKEKQARKLLEMREQPENFLSLIQIGITIVGTLASAIGGVISVTYVAPLIRQIPYAGPVSESSSPHPRGHCPHLLHHGRRGACAEIHRHTLPGAGGPAVWCLFSVFSRRYSSSSCGS